MPGRGRTSSVRSDFLTKGTYQIYRAVDSALAWTAGTEYELTRLSNQVLAFTKDEMYSWVRGRFVLCHADNSHCWGEWFILKMKSADAVPDMDDNDVVEALQKEKRIFATGTLDNANPAYRPNKWIKFEFYNVKLDLGEELRFIWKPYNTTAASGYARSIVEWRMVGE